jgi:carbonic anhydrase/acetyltransferase-like protein (isoleucine patch superfamily)
MEIFPDCPRIEARFFQEGIYVPLASYLGVSPQLETGVYVHPSAQIIGDATLGAQASVWCNAVIRADVNHVRIGTGSNIQDFAMCHVSHKNEKKPLGSPLIIGNYVTIAHSVILHGCTIGDETLIGMGTIVMDDVVIGNHVMVGAGSLVPQGKHLESGFLYLGRPAEKVRALSAAEIAHLRYSAEHYIRVKNNYLAEGADPV